MTLVYLFVTAATQVEVLHDSWCQHHQGGGCNCSPDFYTYDEKGRRRKIA
jgi:hypothetical protein